MLPASDEWKKEKRTIKKINKSFCSFSLFGAKNKRFCSVTELGLVERLAVVSVKRRKEDARLVVGRALAEQIDRTHDLPERERVSE
jgi:hypothetical protein